MIANRKFGIGVLLAAMLLIGVTFVASADSNMDLPEGTIEVMLAGYEQPQIV